jgi:hypothetical protein
MVSAGPANLGCLMLDDAEYTDDETRKGKANVGADNSYQ